MILLLSRCVHKEHIGIDKFLIDVDRPPPLSRANDDWLPDCQRSHGVQIYPAFDVSRLSWTIVIVAIVIVAMATLGGPLLDSGDDGFLEVRKKFRRRFHHVVIAIF